MGTYKACINCVPPKRHPGCQDHCPEHQEEKAINDDLKAKELKRRMIADGLYAQRSIGVHKAMRHRRK